MLLYCELLSRGSIRVWPEACERMRRWKLNLRAISNLCWVVAKVRQNPRIDQLSTFSIPRNPGRRGDRRFCCCVESVKYFRKVQHPQPPEVLWEEGRLFFSSKIWKLWMKKDHIFSSQNLMTFALWRKLSRNILLVVVAQIILSMRTDTTNGRWSCFRRENGLRNEQFEDSTARWLANRSVVLTSKTDASTANYT